MIGFVADIAVAHREKMSANKYIQIKEMNQYILVSTDCLGLGFDDIVNLS